MGKSRRNGEISAHIWPTKIKPREHKIPKLIYNK